ncbi:hypothetical protein THRCLA_08255 [Thraustotheca clavata]|uniref:Cilia- and flagella-associated protein 157 n=1 Tax=Thraustotheca clavata TaxID=74557 RepID=A0A1V9Z7V1_9STRA|nr:hypothetical protein THRCLA_08255 [Thraustotheca clavata]
MTDAPAVPKVRDIGSIALEALGKIDTVLAFELSVMNDHMKTMEQENALLKAENNTLKAKLLQQREDEADIYFYLHKKLDGNYEVISQLENEIESVKREKTTMEEQYNSDLAAKTEQFSKEKKDWSERMESAESTLHALELFQERKTALENTLDQLESQLTREKDQHRQQLMDIERKNIQEKERIKKEMLVKIKENKQNLLAMTEDQLHTTTKRTMMENDQMISELQYQSKETEKLLAKYKAIEAEVTQLRLQLKLNKETEVEMAKRTHFYQKLIKKLNERAQSDQIAAKNHQALLNQEDSSKADVNRANEAMISILNEKTTQLEKQLQALSSELTDTREQLEAARREKVQFLGEQDDTLRFLSTAIHDITHQLALTPTNKFTPKEWQAGDIIPARLDDLAPTDIKKVLQMLFGKLHAYQAKVVQICSAKSDTNRENLEKQFGVELPPISPPLTSSSGRDQLDILSELANRGDSVQSATRNEKNIYNDAGELRQRSIACQTLPCWTEFRRHGRQQNQSHPVSVCKKTSQTTKPYRNQRVNEKKLRISEWPEQFPVITNRREENTFDFSKVNGTLQNVLPPPRTLVKKRIFLPPAPQIHSQYS